MTTGELNALRSLERRLFGDDGEGGAIGSIRSDLVTIRTEQAETRGAVKLANRLLAFVGFGGIVSIIGAIAYIGPGSPR